MGDQKITNLKYCLIVSKCIYLTINIYTLKEWFMYKLYEKKILDLAKQQGVLRPRDLTPYEIPRVYLGRLVADGLLRRVGRGLYIGADADPTEHHSLAEACKRVPHGIICLLSALQFHDLTTQLTYEIWMTISQTARLPKVDQPAIRFHRFSGPALIEGVEEYRIEGVLVKVYNPAKTVADCFKYRNKIGLDVAIEALKDCLYQRKATPSELWDYAKVCRMTNVMKPYVEAMQ